MTPERWARIQDLFHEALERPESERSTFLSQVAAEDRELVPVLERMLDSEKRRSSRFMEPPRSIQDLGSGVDFDPLPEGTMVAGYRVMGVLGTGGMAVVYLAEQPTLKRPVALKVLPREFAHDELRVALFRREARSAGRLRHPNLVPVLDFGETDGTWYYTMEFVPGPNLGQWVQARRPDGAEPRTQEAPWPGPDPTTPRNAAEVVEKIALALDYLHSQRVIHRDVKPQNIVVDGNGEPCLVDFGLARDAELETLTRTLEIKGTPHYMSPEQARGASAKVDARSDLYSLGAVLYELLTQQPPARGKTSHEILYEILHHDPEPIEKLAPSVPEALRRICAQAMAKDPAERYQSGHEFAADLRRFLEGGRVIAQTPTPATKAAAATGKTVDRRRFLIGGAALLAAGAAGGWWLRNGRGAQGAAKARLRVQLPPESSSVSVFVLRESWPAWNYLPAEELGRVRNGERSFALDPGRVRIVLVDDEDSNRFGEFTRDLFAEMECVLTPPRLRPTATEDTALVTDQSTEISLLWRGAEKDERRSYPTVVHSFRIDKFPTSNAEIERFLRARDRTFQSMWERDAAVQSLVTREHWESLPATWYSWAVARDYAESIGKRLVGFGESRLAALGPDRGAWVRAELGDRFLDAFVVGRPERVPSPPEGLNPKIAAFLQEVEPARQSQGHGPYDLHHVIGNTAVWTDSRAIALRSDSQYPPEVETLLELTDNSYWFTRREPLEEDPFGVMGVAPRDQPFPDVGIRCARSVSAPV